MHHEALEVCFIANSVRRRWRRSGLSAIWMNMLEADIRRTQGNGWGQRSDRAGSAGRFRTKSSRGGVAVNFIIPK
jgi:hypothetical protein